MCENTPRGAGVTPELSAAVRKQGVRPLGGKQAQRHLLRGSFSLSIPASGDEWPGCGWALLCHAGGGVQARGQPQVTELRSGDRPTGLS